jgi:fission 1 protein
MAKVMLEEFISEQELEKSRDKYNSIKKPTENDQFELGLNLVRAKNRVDVKEGLSMFQILFTESNDDDLKRDVLYYMAVAQTKLNNYEEALKYLQSILNVQPNNDQVKELYVEVNRKMKRDGLIGLGIVGSAALVGFFGVVGLGAAMLASRK